MKVFNSRSAVEEYTSTHPLGFSTPDLILKQFVIWLYEQVNEHNGDEKIPRIMLYFKREENSEGKKDFPKPLYPNQLLRQKINVITSNKQTYVLESKFCIECGSKLGLNSKFCTKCGTKQVEI
jgi:ribosomal protein L40E